MALQSVFCAGEYSLCYSVPHVLSILQCCNNLIMVAFCLGAVLQPQVTEEKQASAVLSQAPHVVDMDLVPASQVCVVLL